MRENTKRADKKTFPREPFVTSRGVHSTEAGKIGGERRERSKPQERLNGTVGRAAEARV